MLESDFKSISSSEIEWTKLSGKTVLITGASGFLPAYMVETILMLNKTNLVAAPCKVVALVRNMDYAKQRFNSHSSDQNLEFLVQDISTKIDYEQKIDFIIHAASPASPKYYNTDPVGVIKPNIIGTMNTLDLAITNEIEGYLYFSSAEVYGEVEGTQNINENSFGYLDPTKIRSCYPESKRMGENICICYGYKYELPVKIVRPFHTYGPGMKLDDGRVFADFVKNIVNDENIKLKSNGEALRAFCYLSDATIAFFKVLLYGESNEAYNVSNPAELVSIRGLADILVGLYPEKNLKVILSGQNENHQDNSVYKQIPDIAKIKRLGWSPSISISEGFNRTIGSYK